MNPILSKTFSYLRFPLIVGVVLIHVNLSFRPCSYWFEGISYFLSDVVSRLCVPMFFIISGYLFFNIDNFNKSIYIEKIKSRIKSLLIPLLCWNTLSLLAVFLLCYSLGKFPATSSYTSWWNDTFATKNLLQIFKDIYWDPKIAYQFWFIRDLFILVLLSPIIYILIKYVRLFAVIVLGILWYFNLSFITIPSIAAIFFFFCGAYLRLSKRENVLLNFKSGLSIISILYPIVAVANIFFRNNYIHNLGIILGVIFMFNIVSYFIQRDKLHTNEFLAKASFFVFAFHEPLLTIIKKVYVKLFPATNAFMPIIEYFGQAFVVILISLIAYKILKKYLPKINSLLMGGK